MSSGVYGADVAQLHELARQLQAASDRLDGSRRRIGTDIRIAAWIGPVAVRFRVQWDNDYSQRVQSASDALETMANTIIRNAEEQERASRADGGTKGGAVGSIPGLPSDMTDAAFDILGKMVAAEGFVFDLDGLVSALVKVMNGASGFRSGLEVLAEFRTIGGILGAVGLIFEAFELAEAFAEGDTGAQVMGILDLAVGVIGLFVPGAGLAWEAGKLVGNLMYAGINTFYDQPGGAYAAGARAELGSGVDLNNLTPEQAERVAHRYDGLGGVANSISDSMVGAGDDFLAFIGGTR